MILANHNRKLQSLLFSVEEPEIDGDTYNVSVLEIELFNKYKEKFQIESDIFNRAEFVEECIKKMLTKDQKIKFNGFVQFVISKV